MKIKFVCITLLSVVLCSCNNQNEEPIEQPSPKIASGAYLVSEDQAIDEAVDFLKAQGSSAPSKRLAHAKRKAGSVSTTNSTTKQEGVYIVNFDNNGGYAVVSADKRDGASVYIAASEGNFDENDSECQELLSLVRDYQNTTISSGSYNPDKGDGETTETTIVEENYGPLLNTCWHQWWPFNHEICSIYNLSSNSQVYMGCVTVAIGQIINYFQYPNSINGESINWSLVSSATGNQTSATSATNAVSRLLYLVGTGLGINYPSESGATYNQAKNEFQSLGYSYTTRDGFDINVIKSQVMAGKPVYMRGQNESSGHAWVADGFMKVRTEYRTYDDNGDLVENTDLNDYNYDNISDYLHLNMGWGSYGICYKETRFEYSSSNDNRVWVYSNIFNFVSNGVNTSYNDNIKLIYNFATNN